MTDQGVRAGATGTNYDALYRGDFAAFNRREKAQAIGLEVAVVPWDIGQPQPAVVDCERAGVFGGEVLDLGCGRGDNALFLAERGHRVLGIDSSPAAVEQALARVRGEAAVEFEVADATALPGYAGRFGSALDSALYHCLDEQQRVEYLAALHRACAPGARLCLVCFSDAVPDEMPGPYRIGADELRRTLGRGWDVQRLESASYTTAFTREHVRGGFFERAGLECDERGRIVVPAWLAVAQRR